MTNDETNPKFELRIAEHVTLTTSAFLRPSTFVLRHFLGVHSCSFVVKD